MTDPTDPPTVEDVIDPGPLAGIRFADPEAAKRVLQRLNAGPDYAQALDQVLPHLVQALARAGNPDRVLGSLDRLTGQVKDPLAFLCFIANNPRAVEILAALFDGSQYLTEILLRNPAYIERLVETKRLAVPKSVETYYTEAQEAVVAAEIAEEKLDALRSFQRWELLRIGACDLLGLYDLPAVTRQLSNLADSLVRSCLKIGAAQVGIPRDSLVVIALGKLGGRELNYSSDIDLLFIITPGEEAPIEALQRLGQRLIDGLAQVTEEGFLYRVDMRLRPWGKVGPLIVSPEGYISYLQKNARLWEKQALLKARVIAGSQAAGKEFLTKARELIFGASFDVLRPEVFAMKQRMEAQLKQKSRDWGEVKLGEGSIRDIEFTVQLLQLAYGVEQPEILTPNTLDALSRLASFHRIGTEEARMLTEGYLFLRTIEHHLQLMDYRQNHRLPSDPQAIAHLARRLGFSADQPAERFLAAYQQQCEHIRGIFLHYVGSSDMTPSPDPTSENAHAVPSPEVHRHIDRMAPSYAERFSPAEMTHHAEMAGILNDSHPAEVDAVRREDGSFQVTVVALDYPGELSLICGLMVVHGLDISSGDAFTYEARDDANADTRRKIVDVFTVRPVDLQGTPATLWDDYRADLTAFLQKVRAGQRAEARGELARRVAMSLTVSGRIPDNTDLRILYPIEIQVDNESSDAYTVLRIDTRDTFGFLYEFTNAVALSGVYIARMTVETAGNRVQDTLFVTDANGHKITDLHKQRELRAETSLIKHFTHLLPLSPNPESALLQFGKFLADLFKRPDWPDELTSLERPEVLDALARLLGVSNFLWDDFLRMQHANLFPVVRDVDSLSTAKSRAQLQAEMEEALRAVHSGPAAPSSEAPWIDALNAFKDREMFRIDMRHILGHTREFWDFAAELTDLAEVVVNAFFHLCHEDLRLVYGTPRLENGETSQMSVAGLGKFGGVELGFASDIELMFVYAGNGKTSGPTVITTTEFYEKLVQYFISSIHARREGIFDVDLQLRPYGKAGSLSVSLDAFRRYFSPTGPAWAYERQALVKLRPVAGDKALGEQLSALRDECIYTGERFDVSAMRAMRERQLRHLVKGSTFNAKYSLGGLVDIEYLVQGLQISNGYAQPELRQTNTRDAMAALAEAGILSADDYTRLRKAHTFERWLIDSMRVVRGNAKDVSMPAVASEEFAYLARRMRYGADTPRLQEELERYTEDVRELNLRLLRR
jgi:glutamate-ammonia-ligase adenylyltransferase